MDLTAGRFHMSVCLCFNNMCYYELLFISKVLLKLFFKLGLNLRLLIIHCHNMSFLSHSSFEILT